MIQVFVDVAHLRDRTQYWQTKASSARHRPSNRQRAKGPLPYDFQPLDIPLRFIGQGVIAERLQSRPATFNVPSRRELERALKYFNHILDPSGGKGGHQKWTGPTNAHSL